MNKKSLSTELVKLCNFNQEDIKIIYNRRRNYNRLGFAYQLVYVKLFNKFPKQNNFIIEDYIINLLISKLKISIESINEYCKRRQTISEHQTEIQSYLGLAKLNNMNEKLINEHIFEDALSTVSKTLLLDKAKYHLKQAKILEPAVSELLRIVKHQRISAVTCIFDKITNQLSDHQKGDLDNLVRVDSEQSVFASLKSPTDKASAGAITKLCKKLDLINKTNVHEVNLSWVNNNMKRMLTRRAYYSTASRIKELKNNHRYAVLVCFIQSIYQNCIDDLFNMFEKLMNNIERRAQNKVDTYHKSKKKQTKHIIQQFNKISGLILNSSIDDKDLRSKIFETVSKDVLKQGKEYSDSILLNKKYTESFNMVIENHHYIYKFTKHILKYLHFNDDEKNQSLLKALSILDEMNRSGKRTLPQKVPTEFMSKKLKKLVGINNEINKQAYECAVMSTMRNEVKFGNLIIKRSNRYVDINSFMINDSQWNKIRKEFFIRNNLPQSPHEVINFLQKKLNKTYDKFLNNLPNNGYVSFKDENLKISIDVTNTLNTDDSNALIKLRSYIRQNLRQTKLTDLLIEVNNYLDFTTPFTNPNSIKDIQITIATIIAHGCNIGIHTMAQLTKDISYDKLKHVSDWNITEEAQREALAKIVNAISNLDITQAWGDGTTSSSDGQRFSMNRKLLQQNYSHKFNDYALEFYSFVADNYAPFYSKPIECTDRDAHYVLDGLLYNESDLPLEEHYTDTHGYTDINFAAFTMLGRKFAPRIRDIKKQRIYKIDCSRNYGKLEKTLNHHHRIINTDIIVEQWDKIAQFYASFEEGHTTASNALKRLNGFNGKNRFYRANIELGRVFKTEYILKFLSDKNLRIRTRKGLLKGEQLHQLARDVTYGNQGKMTKSSWEQQKMSCSCLTIILASIIYWQAKEMNRVISKCDEPDINFSMIKYISPIKWSNITLYGNYDIDLKLIKMKN